jgi:hypothetical protein
LSAGLSSGEGGYGSLWSSQGDSFDYSIYEKCPVQVSQLRRVKECRDVVLMEERVEVSQLLQTGGSPGSNESPESPPTTLF